MITAKKAFITTHAVTSELRKVITNMILIEVGTERGIRTADTRSRKEWLCLLILILKRKLTVKTIKKKLGPSRIFFAFLQTSVGV